MRNSKTQLTRYMGRRTVHGLAVLADLEPVADVTRLADPAQLRRPGAALSVFCVQCGQEQSRRLCSSCGAEKNG
jgi:hypothetical protein